MRRKLPVFFLIVVCCLIWPVTKPSAGEQDAVTKSAVVELEGWHLGGGGGSSKGGPFEIGATVGQTSVGTAVGGSFVLEAGLLAGAAPPGGFLFGDGFESNSANSWTAIVGW